jgi:hypothetical protein
MQFAERDVGDYRICARARKAPQNRGYIAGVIVSRQAGTVESQRLAYRDQNLAGGYVWASADDALLYAMSMAKEMICTEPYRLMC